MNRQEILDLLGEHRGEVRQFGAQSLALFGSFAREQARQDSDIDLLVEFISPPTFDDYMNLKFYLEDLLGRAVDLVPRKTLKPRILPQVEREAIYVT